MELLEIQQSAQSNVNKELLRNKEKSDLPTIGTPGNLFLDNTLKCCAANLHPKLTEGVGSCFQKTPVQEPFGNGWPSGNLHFNYSVFLICCAFMGRPFHFPRAHKSVRYLVKESSGVPIIKLSVHSQ